MLMYLKGDVPEIDSKSFQPCFQNFEINRAATFAWELSQGRVPLGHAPDWKRLLLYLIQGYSN